MKKILYILLTAISIFGATSCSDMLETESNRQLTEPSLDQKTDSVFYAYGILQALQQLGDQYFFQNELRGDLVKTTDYASQDLKDLANFEADASNKYDSVYLYYKVINNCNYYLKNRKTDLVTGSTYVVMNEYIAVAAIRAWAYMQLTRNYGDVPYVTEPVTSITQINASGTPTSASTILASEAAYLKNLKESWEPSYWETPTFGRDAFSIGSTNFGITKNILISKCFMPINVVLGDLYLENGEYENAAKAYYDYLYYSALSSSSSINVNYATFFYDRSGGQMPHTRDLELPSDYSTYSLTGQGYNYNAFKDLNSGDWETIFGMTSAPGDVITYIPMAVSSSEGQITNVPDAFGYTYYESASSYVANYRFGSCPESNEISVVPADSFKTIYENATYNYITTDASTSQRFRTLSSANIGDARFNMIARGSGADTTAIFVQKPSTGNFNIYRTTTVYLHLAEAMNRMGYPDAAFAVLKDGLSQDLKNYVDTMYAKQDFDHPGTQETFPQENFYISTKTQELLSTIFPFMTETTVFSNKYTLGIHQHGAGICGGASYSLKSPYQYNTEVGKKIAELNSKFKDVNITSPTLQDTINAIEDILCDEYALEFAFEGTRFSDLQRLARHKNESGLYGSNFGDLWLTDKLKRDGRKDITTKNCYLPFK